MIHCHHSYIIFKLIETFLQVEVYINYEFIYSIVAAYIVPSCLRHLSRPIKLYIIIGYSDGVTSDVKYFLTLSVGALLKLVL